MRGQQEYTYNVTGLLFNCREHGLHRAGMTLATERRFGPAYKTVHPYCRLCNNLNTKAYAILNRQSESERLKAWYELNRGRKLERMRTRRGMRKWASVSTAQKRLASGATRETKAETSTPSSKMKSSMYCSQIRIVAG
jgi:hypothetical protein